MYLLAWIQTSQTGSQPYSDISSYKIIGYSLLKVTETNYDTSLKKQLNGPSLMSKTALPLSNAPYTHPSIYLL